jgi:predicted nucleotidyltransferase
MGSQPKGEQAGAEQMAMYRRTAFLREQERQRYAAERRAEALEIARRAADLLKREFGATRVVVYGSTAHGRWFHADSDIDLMAEGIPAKLYWRAWNAVDALDQKFEVNLVDWEDARPALRDAIEREGIIL